MKTVLFMVLTMGVAPVMVEDQFTTTDACTVQGERMVTHKGWYLGQHEIKPLGYMCLRIETGMPTNEEISESLKTHADEGERK